MDIDVTIIFQLGLFLVVLVFVTGLVIRPLLRVIEAREQRTVGARHEAERLERLASENKDAYVARIREARTVARHEREALRAKANEEKQRLLANVRVELGVAAVRGREVLARSEAEARAQLAAERSNLAHQLVAKIAGREVQP